MEKNCLPRAKATFFLSKYYSKNLAYLSFSLKKQKKKQRQKKKHSPKLTF